MNTVLKEELEVYVSLKEEIKRKGLQKGRYDLIMTRITFVS